MHVRMHASRPCCLERPLGALLPLRSHPLLPLCPPCCCKRAAPCCRVAHPSAPSSPWPLLGLFVAGDLFLTLLRIFFAALSAAGDFSTRFAGQIKDFDSQGLIVKKWEKRIDNVMK